ncbi:hypothetical protein WMW72_09360 [Paenibacillus filicis]|uniref:Uncharacterized protein n=1 Tax=Paenibacillus filicis TaxID=669464 RepID=A0ABU9DGV5_9BACL
MSNNAFLICFILLAILLLFTNMKHWTKMPRSIRRFYVCMYVVTFGLYTAMLFHLPIPMPTRIFIEKVSPWVYSIIHSK